MKRILKFLVAAMFLSGFGITSSHALRCEFEPPTGPSLGLGDDTFANVSGLLPPGTGFNYFGTSYGPGQAGGGIFANANGSVSFGAGDFDFTESLDEFGTGVPKIAGLWVDLNPSTLNGGGAVRAEVQSNPERLIVTWDDVPEFLNSGSNTFQITVFLGSGQFRVFYNGLTATDGLIGASSGGGAAVFVESDFTAKKLTKGTQPGFVAEQFTGGGDSVDVDGKCFMYNPTPKASRTPQAHKR